MSPPGSPDCLREDGFFYSGGDIFEWKGATQEHCESLAASTTGGLFWSYKPSVRLGNGLWIYSRCWVKKTNEGKRIARFDGVVSGNQACGKPLPGKISDFA